MASNKFKINTIRVQNGYKIIYMSNLYSKIKYPNHESKIYMICFKQVDINFYRNKTDTETFGMKGK